MIVDERITSFINSMNKDDRDIVAQIEIEALQDQVPIIRRETKELIKVLILMKQPLNILEVGTAVGFSSIYMSEYIGDESHITTIEKYEPRVIKARENIKLAGKEDKITLIDGDASDVLKSLDGSYDMIFMDAAKGQYINFLPDILRLLSKNGVIISDNVLQDGDVLESHFTVNKRNRTIHSRMREYLYTLKNLEGMETAIVPIGDGVAISTRVKEK